MLTLLNSAIGMFLALAFLVLAITAPFLALWIGLSMRRDLRRIADNLEGARFAAQPAGEGSGPYGTAEELYLSRKVSNSALGR